MNRMRNAECGMRNLLCHLNEEKYGPSLPAPARRIPHSAIQNQFRIPQ
jgi:hypothetical protein